MLSVIEQSKEYFDIVASFENTWTQVPSYNGGIKIDVSKYQLSIAKAADVVLRISKGKTAAIFADPTGVNGKFWNIVATYPQIAVRYVDDIDHNAVFIESNE